MKKFLSTLFMATCTGAIMAQAPAFPGAEGHGRYVTGGRGGNIIHVTNLNDKGTGSLRAAVSGSSKKIIVFDVAGVIPLASNLSIGDNTTILGQTAPYPGITLRYYTVSPGSNNIIRFIRIRRGQEKDVNDGADASTQRHRTGIIFDHCSFSWSIDEVASFYDNNNFTMQWCTVAESLCNAGHDKGAHGYGGIWGGKLASFHHNMIAHVANRSPRFNGARYGWTGYNDNYDYATYKWKNPVQAENVDFRNCLMNNYGSGSCYGGPGGGQVNIVNNYYKAGPETSPSVITQVTVSSSGNSDSKHPEYYGMTSRYYISGNTTCTNNGTIVNNRDGNGVSYDNGTYTLNGERYTEDKNNFYDADHVTINGVSCVKMKLDSPAPTGVVTTHTAAVAYNKILEYCGASMFRDDVDDRYMKEAKSGKPTYKGSVTKKQGRIDLVSDVDGYTEKNFPTGSWAQGYDSDKDGMPDAWETANGLNPNDASDAKTYTLDSKGYYTNLEVYANSLVEEIMKNENADAMSPVDEYYPTVTKAEGIEYYTGRVVERVENSGGGESGGTETPDTPETITGESGTITWAFNTGNTNEKPVISSNIAGAIASTAITLGSNMSISGTASNNGTVQTKLQPIVTSTAATENDVIKFSIITADGMKFQPTNVAFNITRCGTEGGNYDVAWENASGETSIVTGQRPNRNNAENGWWTAFSHDVTATAANGTSSLVVYVYNYNGKEKSSPKQCAMHQVVITGTVASTTGISDTNYNNKVLRTEYFSLDGKRLDTPQTGINIRKVVFADGKTKIDKIIK